MKTTAARFSQNALRKNIDNFQDVVNGFIVSLIVINAETTSLSDLPKKNVNIVKNLNYTLGLDMKRISVFHTLCFFSNGSFRIRALPV